MNFRRHFVLPALALALSSGAKAVSVVPAGINAGKIPDIIVWDEDNIRHSLWDELQVAGTGPVIVLPVYTRCTMSCPVLARMLVKQTSQISSGTPYRVLIFSFDAGDDARALRQFRLQEKLPPEWILVRSGAADIRRFCDFFHYSVLTEGTVMIHANQMFLLNHDLQWRATFIDQSWNAVALHTWMSRVESPGLFGWLAMNPEVMVFIGFGLLVVSLMLILGIFILRPDFSSKLPTRSVKAKSLSSATAPE